MPGANEALNQSAKTVATVLECVQTKWNVDMTGMSIRVEHVQRLPVERTNDGRDVHDW